MELFPTLFSAGWASGVNAYATVVLLSVLGRAGVGDVPDALQSDPVTAVAAVMYAVEFVTDKIPYLDSLWDGIHTVIRPAVASAIGATYGADADLGTLDEVFASGGSGLTALASHAVKASIRLGINASPEPASNIIASLTEDGLVGLVVFFAVENPVIAAVIAAVLLVAGIALVIVIARKVRQGLQRWRARRQAR